jgi:hypothetical protein
MFGLEDRLLEDNAVLKSQIEKLNSKIKDLEAKLETAQSLVKNFEYDSKDSTNYYYYSCYGEDYFKKLINLLNNK